MYYSSIVATNWIVMYIYYKAPICHQMRNEHSRPRADYNKASYTNLLLGIAVISVTATFIGFCRRVGMRFVLCRIWRCMEVNHFFRFSFVIVFLITESITDPCYQTSIIFYHMFACKTSDKGYVTTQSRTKLSLLGNKPSQSYSIQLMTCTSRNTTTTEN